MIDKRISEPFARYEKFRNIIGFQGEYLWRRQAISRIVKRLYRSEYHRDAIGQYFLEEMVLAKYLPDSKATPEIVAKAESTIEYYFELYQVCVKVGYLSKRKVRNWFFDIMAVALEDDLGLLDSEQALINTLIPELKNRLIFPSTELSNFQKEFFLLLSIGHVIAWTDRAFVAYFSLKRFGAKKENKSCEQTLQATRIWYQFEIIKDLEQDPLYRTILKIAEPRITVYLILEEVLKKYNKNLKYIKEKTYTVFTGICSYLKERMKQRYKYSFIYLAITKLGLVIFVESVYDIWRDGVVHIPQMVANLTIPIALFAVLVTRIKITSKENTKRIIEYVENAAYGQDTQMETNVLQTARSFACDSLFNVVVIFSYLFTYGGLLVLLYLLHFNLVSGFFFILFITMVTFFTVRIKFNAERFNIIKQKPKMWQDNITFFILPILSIGQWIVLWIGGRNNLLLISIDFLIEKPYKGFLFLLRDFVDYIGDRLEDME